MALSPIEAIGLYEFGNRKKKSGKNPPPFKMVIVNADDYSLGFCTCDENGNIEVVEKKELAGAESCMSDIDTAFQNATKRDDGFSKSIAPFVDSFNSEMRTYYRGERQKNADFKVEPGWKIDCRTLDEIFGMSRNRLEELLAGADDLWSQTGFDEENTCIIIAGEAARYFPVVYCIKGFFTFDPFLTDERFVSDVYEDEADEIIRIGTLEYNKKIEEEQSFYLSAVDRNGAHVKIALPFASEMDQDMRFVGPVFASGKVGLKIEHRSRVILIEIPFLSAPTDCDLIEIGACRKNGEPMICIRRCGETNRIFNIPAV